MALFWFLAGMLTALAGVVVILPWLRTIPALQSLPAVPWQAPIVAMLTVAVVLGLYHRWGRPDLVAQPQAAPVASAATSVANRADDLPGPPSKTAAGSMTGAIASLQARLAKGGGTPEDWELLAKSYEFLGRPDDAAKAREHRFPSAQSGTAIMGEVSLAAALRDRAKAGDTLFIVAKSVDSPGVPVAVLRSSVGEWPVKFRLDDSQSMLPGRNLSSAGRVKIEARISASGQALPVAGDLQGSSAVLDPADGKPLKIVIDEVVT
jgi:hypothetical protein